mgnify:FL=1
MYEHPFLVYPGRADKKNLQPMNDKVSKAMRQADPTRLVFFEPVTWDYWYAYVSQMLMLLYFGP